MSKNEFNILAIDDEKDILLLLKFNLESEGYHVKTASSGKEGIKIAEKFNPDLILLDIMMPDMDGIETCRRFREMEKFQSTYILFLTARVEEYSEVAAFDAGGDDYITKPIKPRALISRINSFYKRESSKKSSKNVVQVDSLLIDRDSYIVKLDDKEIFFPKKEFELLYFLSKNPKKVYSRESLLRNIWGSGVHVVPRTVDVHIRKIREKLGQEYITTIKGVGYRFKN
ncbi:MAG: DNA-binding response regulator [Cytophagia bacterium]|jgi:two-component system alkaline phosphatase synthesis response regulator PhoP|nr:DNA-binding response regulator [Cytophagia bacterium]|tara:strand:+ start:770 stop:1453 length:684 start_codon:yes stop_codon:yes gene_type:complete